MPIQRRGKRMVVGKMHNIRKGGRVTLFNYNPSIAGGKIAVKRFGRAHRLGGVMKNWAGKHMASMIGAQGQGLMPPGHHAATRGGALSHGENMREGRKRILAGLGAQFNKRLRT